MKQRNKTLRKKVFERDNFTCQKCQIQDLSQKSLEAHHIIPLYLEGEDDLSNLITLCSVCHKFAPDNKEEFTNYMKEEMDGELTVLMKVWKQAIDRGLLKEINIEESNKVQGKLK